LKPSQGEREKDTAAGGLLEHGAGLCNSTAVGDEEMVEVVCTVLKKRVWISVFVSYKGTVPSESFDCLFFVKGALPTSLYLVYERFPNLASKLRRYST
jgi:hypothetical protein